MSIIIVIISESHYFRHISIWASLGAICVSSIIIWGIQCIIGILGTLHTVFAHHQSSQFLYTVDFCAIRSSAE